MFKHQNVSDFPDYKAFLTENRCPDPDEVSAEGLTGKSEQDKEELPVETSTDPVSNPSNDPNFFNYFMSQFVRCAMLIDNFLH